MTFVKTKLELEKLKTGEILEVILSSGEPLENVPKSAVEQGYRILGITRVEGNVYRVEIEK